eukprot:6897888-Prorocentrum_lima.AAC.1
MADRPCYFAPPMHLPLVSDYDPEVEPDEVEVADFVPSNFVYDAGPPERKPPLLPDPNKERSLRDQ